MNAILQLFSKIVEIFLKFRNLVICHRKLVRLVWMLDCSLLFWEKKRKSNNSPTPCNYIMELKMSQLIDGRFKFTKPKFISRNYLMDSKSCENKLKVFVLKIHTYTLHIRFGISQQTSISFGINRCKFNSSTVQTTLKS